MVGDLIQQPTKGGVGDLVGGDREIAVLEVRGREVLTIAHRTPVEEILLAVGRHRQHLEQHDGFVEMIEIVGGEQGYRIDIGAVKMHRVDPGEGGSGANLSRRGGHRG